MDDVRRTAVRNRVAVLVAVLAFAVVAVGLAVVAGGGPGSGDASLPKLPLAVGAERTAAAAVDNSAGASMAPESNVTYRFDGEPPAMPSEAQAHRLERADVRAAASDLAAALGLEGAPEKRDESWVVHDDEGELVVHETTGLPWYHGSVTTCPDKPVSSDGREAGSCVVASDQPLDVDATPPPREQVEEAVRPVFERMGLAVEALEVIEGTAVLRPRVDGMRTVGWEQALTVDSKGTVVGGYGWLGRPEELGEYPLVDVPAALERLRTGFGYGPRTMTAATEPAIAVDDSAEPQPQEVVLTGVELGLQMIEAHLVPSFLFSVADGEGPVVVAVEDRLLEELAPQSQPEPAPMPPDGSGSGSGSTGSSGQACSGSASASAPPEGGTEPANQPLTVEVCGPTEAKVGEEVAFEVTAVDGDAEIVESGGCGEPRATFGDEEGAGPGECIADCGLPLGESRAGKLHRTFRHAYSKPGTYTATFAFQSAHCTKGASSGEASHTIVVR
jgi:hypothetical protein